MAAGSSAGGYEPDAAEVPVPADVPGPGEVAAPSDARTSAREGRAPATAATPSPPSPPPEPGRAVRAPDPAARLPGGKEGSEYWDLLARFEQGHFVFARFLLTNLGPGKHSAVVLGHWIMPDGTRHAFRNGRRRAEWQLSPDRLKLDVNKCHLDLRDGSALLTVRKASVQLSLRFALTGGARPPSGVIPDRYAADTLAANAPVEGTFRLHGMEAPAEVRGTGAVTHTWTTDPEQQRVARRLDFFTLTPGLGLQLSEFRLPDGSVRRWLRGTREGRTLLESTDATVAASGRLAGAPGDYPVERQWQIDGSDVSGEVSLARLLHQQDPLEAIPQPLRSVIRWSVSMKPHQLWATAPFDLSVHLPAAGSATPLRGEGVAAVAFLVPR